VARLRDAGEGGAELMPLTSALLREAADALDALASELRLAEGLCCEHCPADLNKAEVASSSPKEAHNLNLPDPDSAQQGWGVMHDANGLGCARYRHPALGCKVTDWRFCERGP
jgi:hypothetical protein